MNSLDTFVLWVNRIMFNVVTFVTTQDKYVFFLVHFFFLLLCFVPQLAYFFQFQTEPIKGSLRNPGL